VSFSQLAEEQRNAYEGQDQFLAIAYLQHSIQVWHSAHKLDGAKVQSCIFSFSRILCVEWYAHPTM
jgi:hypothetical protein